MEPKGGFDFKERMEFSPQCFKSTIVQGPAQLRDKVRSIPSRDPTAPFFGCLLTLGPQDTYTGSQWVGGGKLDDEGVTFSAASIFSGAPKALHLALVTDLDCFDFPLSGSNFSAYREVPYQVPVVAYLTPAEGQAKEVISWERAKELGCKDFTMRVVVMPVSTKENLVQVGTTPFSLNELKELYGEVFDQPYFPNTMVRVSKSQTKLPSFMGLKTSCLVKSVETVLEDTEGVGMGILPFTTCPTPGPGGVQRPPTAVVKQALYNHMHAGHQPVTRTPSRMAEALSTALLADKAPENILPPLWSPWPALVPGGDLASVRSDQGTRPSSKQKYSGYGGFSADTFVKLGVPEYLAAGMETTGNFGLSQGTWKAYGTVDRHLKACYQDTGRCGRFPLPPADVLTFLAWLINRGIKASTVQVYLSGLRMAHLTRGCFGVSIYEDIISHMVKGLKQRDLVKDKIAGKVGRLPVTMDVLTKLRVAIRKSDWDMAKKRLVWAVCCLAFNGSFRVHELLSRETRKFDPTSTLLKKDVTVSSCQEGQARTEVLQVYLKSPKEARLSDGVMVDLFATSSFFCPVEAFRKYVAALPFTLEASSPLFRSSSGVGYTGAGFNSDLKFLLRGQVDYSKGKITSHSFRAGLATEMAKLGFQDQEIMNIGRWRSSAYLSYVKCPRVKRMKIAKQLATGLLAQRT